MCVYAAACAVVGQGSQPPTKAIRRESSSRMGPLEVLEPIGGGDAVGGLPLQYAGEEPLYLKR
eukprot:scaffold13820_cov46-Attheya_sp.AAC.3